MWNRKIKISVPKPVPVKGEQFLDPLIKSVMERKAKIEKTPKRAANDDQREYMRQAVEESYPYVLEILMHEEGASRFKTLVIPSDPAVAPSDSEFVGFQESYLRRNPIDLGTIEKNILDRQYDSAQDFFNHVDKVFQKYQSFFPVSHELYLKAVELQRRFHTLFDHWENNLFICPSPTSNYLAYRERLIQSIVQNMKQEQVRRGRSSGSNSLVELKRFQAITKNRKEYPALTRTDPGETVRWYRTGRGPAVQFASNDLQVKTEEEIEALEEFMRMVTGEDEGSRCDAQEMEYYMDESESMTEATETRMDLNREKILRHLQEKAIGKK